MIISDLGRFILLLTLLTVPVLAQGPEIMTWDEYHAPRVNLSR
jgi:hypothetical protein